MFIPIDQQLTNGLIAGVSVASAGAVLSVVVVLRRWAFLGESVGHSAFGGAGVAWLAGLLLPALDRPWATEAAVVLFCIATALLIGRLTRGGRTTFDAVVGAFLVASLAFGFLAQQIYLRHRGMMPPNAENLLFGRLGDVSSSFALASALLCAGVLLVIALLGKEIMAYSFDPLTARTCGVRVGLIQDLLMVLLATVVIIGARIVGSVLVVALLVLPGATALLISRRLPAVLVAAVAAALLGT
ncbi:MAG: metal ABC transporter permease, partial [Tepidisphaeraceae bacterium]